MVIVVVVINVLISLILFYLAWRLWQLRRRLAKIANLLIAAERSSHAVLPQAPENIYFFQNNIHNLRQGNQQPQLQIQRLRQIFSLIAFGQQVWRRYFIKFGSTKIMNKRI